VKLIPDPNKLVLQTHVNGQLRQDTNTSDMLFDVRTLISFLSQGTTLEAGSIIMTGTPEGRLCLPCGLMLHRGGICYEATSVFEAR
jgi:2-keto-4-pentenoate hydratase/2-oxohepta-3-ene-1,7-dioic acid hydratase in catechol pathway